MVVRPGHSPDGLGDGARLPSRRRSLRLYSTALPLLLLAEMQPTSISDLVRMGIVRSAKTADSLDSVWQQFSGEVTPSWARRSTPPPPPAPIDHALARELLELPLKLAAESTTLPYSALSERLPAARKQAVLLYPDRYPRSPELARAAGDAAYAFDLEVFALWRVLQDALPAGGDATKLDVRGRYAEQLGEALLAGPFAVDAPPSPTAPGRPPLQPALDDAKALLESLQQVCNRNGMRKNNKGI